MLGRYLGLGLIVLLRVWGGKAIRVSMSLGRLKREHLPGELVATFSRQVLWGHVASSDVRKRGSSWLTKAFHTAVKNGLLTRGDMQATRQFLQWSGAARIPNHEQ
eukprot:5788152-Amphidinium_carterae.1